MGAAAGDEVPTLQEARTKLASLFSAAADVQRSLAGVDDRLSRSLSAAEAAAEAVAPLQIQAMTTKSLHARINRAVSPALAVIRSFSLVESLQRRLLRLSSSPSPTPLPRLLKYVSTVDRLHDAVASVTDGCGPAVQRLQEAVEFLSRTKTTDLLRIHRLPETLTALKSLYEDEVDAMRYEGLLDQSLLRLQDEFEALLLQIRHDISTTPGGGQLGSDTEIDVLGRIAHTLSSNDCIDISIDIYVKVRYRRAAKAMMRLNPEYLKRYEPAEIDGMEWEALETSISLWIEHLELAVDGVFVAEKRLAGGVLGDVMEGAVWMECFAKIADKIMAVFFRFGEGVARSTREPQKLFKMLDMFDAMDRMRDGFVQVFDGEACHDICARFRELQKLLVHAASKLFREFGLHIEGISIQDAATPSLDGSVPKDIRYAVNYLKCVATGGYAAAMGRVLQTEQVWRAGFLSKPEPNESLLRDAVTSVLDALQRNVEAKRRRYKDKAAGHVFAMNTYWYAYMRGRGSELAALVGEEAMRARYKTAAEEAAYAYQAISWMPLVKLLEEEEEEEMDGKEASGAVSRGKMEAFMKGLEETLRRHRSSYCIPDPDLRDQIKEAVTKLVVPAYAGFVHVHAPVSGRAFLPPETIRGLLEKLFGDGDGGDGAIDGLERMRGSLKTRRSVEGDYSGDGGRRSYNEGGGSTRGERWRRGRRSLDVKPNARVVDGGDQGDGSGENGAWRSPDVKPNVRVEGVHISGMRARRKERADSNGIIRELIDYCNSSTRRDWAGRPVSFQATGSIANGLAPILHNSAPQVALFSSRGPYVKDFSFLDADVLKPDILAPGSLIWAAWAPNGTDAVNYIGEGFAMMSGTSMAASHIAGISALIKQKHPKWSPAAIKSALMATASIIDRGGRPLQAQQYSETEITTLVDATPF